MRKGLRRVATSFGLVLFLASGIVVQTQAAAKATDSTFSSTVVLRCDSVASGGSVLIVRVVLSDTTAALGGFNLNIAFDRTALVFDSAKLGDLTAGEWEYFDARSGLLSPSDSSSSIGFVRMVSLADQQDSRNRAPKPRSLVGPGELARLYFYVSERSQLAGATTPLFFVWTKCDDNSFSDRSGIKLYCSRDVFDPHGRRLITGLDKNAGAPNSCFSSKLNSPIRAFSFRNAAVLIK
jgi:hypothetical protein